MVSQAPHRVLRIWKRPWHNNIVPFLDVVYSFGMNGAVSLVSQWMPSDTLHELLAMDDDKLDATLWLQIVCWLILASLSPYRVNFARHCQRLALL